MAEWRRRLREIVQKRREGEDVEETAGVTREPIQAFLETVVRPAFDEVVAEMAQHQRHTRVDEGEDWISITVLNEADEAEFVFAIQGRPFYRMTFAFPELPDDGEADSYTADVLVNGERHEREEMASLSKADVIERFLDEYAQWAGW